MIYNKILRKNIMNKIYTILIFILGLTLIYLKFNNIKSSDKITLMNDEIVKYRDKLNREVSKRTSLEVDRFTLLNNINEKDSIINRLNDIIKINKNIQSIIIVDNYTEIKGDEIIIKDTILGSYYTIIENEWDSGYISIKDDSLYYNIKTRNEYDIIVKYSEKWFKENEYEISVTNRNPNTYTTELRNILLRSKPKRLGIGLHIGYGLDIQRMEPSPYIGIGLNYNLINIK